MWWSLAELRSLVRSPRRRAVFLLWLCCIGVSIVTGALNVTIDQALGSIEPSIDARTAAGELLIPAGDQVPTEK